MTPVYFGLGSNLGDRRGYLESAIERLREAGVANLVRSAIIETEPVYVLDQPRFLNMAVAGETDLPPLELLRVTQTIELALGREKVVDKGPRCIDIDILFYGGLVMSSGELTIPHPALQDRLFVLDPLAEIAPALVHPVLGLTVLELATARRATGSTLP